MRAVVDPKTKRAYMIAEDKMDELSIELHLEIIPILYVDTIILKSVSFICCYTNNKARYYLLSHNPFNLNNKEINHLIDQQFN